MLWPISMLIIGSAFLIISFLLLLFKSNRKLIASKFKLGGIILSISGIISASLPSCMCYAPLPPADFITLDYIYYNNDSNYYEYDKKSDSIKGEISDRITEIFSYQITDSNEALVQGDNLSPIDGSFDTEYEKFSIPINDSLIEGRYSIKFYLKDYNSSKLNPEKHHYLFNLYISK